MANIGHWEFDLINEELYWSDELKSLHEVSLDYEPSLETALEFYEEGEYRDKVLTALNKAISEGESFIVTSKIITKKGNERWALPLLIVTQAATGRL